MAKLNEGDIVEGLFTIALALHLAYGKVDKSALNKIRTQIDTKMFNTGRFKYTVASKLKRQKDKNPADLFNVGFEMRLKPQSVQGAFDKEYELLYKSSKDVGNIDMKINQLITSFKSASFAKKANDAVNYFLDNNASDNVTFTVIADGIAGESSGGELKGDVTLEVYATAKNSNKKIISGAIPFSIKSESVTVANLSPYHGMLDFAKAMDIDWDAEEKYIRLSKRFTGPAEQKAKFELITEMYAELKDEIVKKSKEANFSKTAYAFLRKSIFGSDLANVVDVRSSTVKEITVEHFDELEKKTKLIVKVRGNNLIFEGLYKFAKDEFTFNLPIFQIRTKLIERSTEAKFYLEVGKGIYSK